jgi:hypothetical protein
LVAGLFACFACLSHDALHQDVGVDIIIQRFRLADDGWKASLASFNDQLKK